MEGSKDQSIDEHSHSSQCNDLRYWARCTLFNVDTMSSEGINFSTSVTTPGGGISWRLAVEYFPGGDMVDRKGLEWKIPR